MGSLDYFDYRAEPAAWARRLDISRDAVDLYLDADVIDLHTCSYIWTRVFGYRLDKRHSPFLRGTPFYNQVDFPRAREAQMTGIVWSLDTNPWRRTKSRPHILVRNLRRLRGLLERHPDEFQVVSTYADYVDAKKNGRTASWLAIQGGQALDESLDCLDMVPDNIIHRITLVHFTTNKIGRSSFNEKTAHVGLTPFGKDFVKCMNEKRILVDLAHINRAGFMDALEVHDTSLPPIVTHTGVRGIKDMWRNIDDAQIKAVADMGGTIGIIYQGQFISDSGPWAAPTLWQCTIDQVLDHMEHVMTVAGEDYVSLGSDYDGAIVLPVDWKDITEQPRMVQRMLDRGWSDTRIKKILGDNFLRVVRAIRP